MDSSNRAVIILVIGDLLFGGLGLFVRHFNGLGLDPTTVSFIRSSTVFLVVLSVIIMFRRDCLRIDPKGLLMLMSFGVFKFISDITFLFALENTSLSLATVLQMTFPYFVLILSFLVFRESITFRKLFAMVVTFTGCTILIGGTLSNNYLSVEGMVAAIVSGMFLAAYVLGGTVSYTRGYHPAAYLLYGTMMSGILSFFLCDPDMLVSVLTLDEIPFILGLGILVTLIPVYIQAWSTKHLLPTTISVIATVEIVSATVIGAVFYGEALEPIDLLGIALVICSIFLINARIYKGAKEYLSDNPQIKNILALKWSEYADVSPVRKRAR